jgi:hypothetical protein
MSALAFLKFAHLIALVVGFGCAMLADYLILRQAILRPITRQLTDWLHYVSKFAFLGLAMLWATGLGLIFIRYLDNPAVLSNQKLWAKIVIVILLSINGIIVHKHALRLVSSRVGRKLFDRRSRPEMMGLSMIAAVSSVSWITPMFLGVATELNNKVSVGPVLGIYALLVLCAWAFMMLFVSKIVPYFAVVPSLRVPGSMIQPTHEDIHGKYLDLLQRVKAM